MLKSWYLRLFAPSLPSELEGLVARADAGGPEAQNTLGAFSANGQAMPQNFTTAVACFEKAAGDGHAMAQNNLGLMYASGQGVSRSDAAARKWFRRAADQGDAGGQFNLGVMCHPASLGRFAEKAEEAKIEAYMWFHLAAAQGYRNAAASCEALNVQMSSAEVAEGNRRAAKFLPRSEKPSVNGQDEVLNPISS